VIKIPTIKGPIKIKKGERIPEALLKEAAKNLPFEADNWNSSKNEHLVGKSPEPEKKAKEIKEEEPIEEKDDSKKLLDNYLDQNAKTVIKAIKEDDFDKDTLQELYSLEKLGKNRKKVLDTLKELAEE
jgi:hypothetical protein